MDTEREEIPINTNPDIDQPLLDEASEENILEGNGIDWAIFHKTEQKIIGSNYQVFGHNQQVLLHYHNLQIQLHHLFQ